METLTKTTDTTTIAVVPTTNVLAITLNDQQRQEAIKLASSSPLIALPDSQLVMFGSERQKAMGGSLNGMLTELNKGNNPLLFELFVRLKKGVNDANIPEMESQIRASLKTTWYEKLLDSIGLSSVAKRVKSANEKITTMMASKSKSLGDLMVSMEKEVQDEVLRLINDSERLKRLSLEFRKNVTEFAVYAEAGRQMLAEGRTELAKVKTAAANSNDPIQIEEAKNFEQKVDLFASRVVILETIYTKAPAELQALRLSQGASLSTLGETANSVLEEFNDIKSTLIQLAVAYQIQNVQQINKERRELRASLMKHKTNLLGQIAVDAAKAQGLNRVEDADLLLTIATSIKEISNKVEEEHKNNITRFAEARTKLAEVQKLVLTINT